jgi:hypothetical protein
MGKDVYVCIRVWMCMYAYVHAYVYLYVHAYEQ